MKKIKKYVVAVLAVSFFMLMPAASMADVLIVAKDDCKESNISPRMSYIVEAMCDLAIRGTTATVDCWVEGDYDEATKAKVIAELQVKNSSTNWIPVAIWTDTQNSYRASVYETKTINPDNIYRVKATCTVWEGSQSETITVFSDEL